MRTPSLLALTAPLLLLWGCAGGSTDDASTSGSVPKSYGATVDAGSDDPAFTYTPKKTLPGSNAASDAGVADGAPAPAQWTVGGTVTGLAGTGLVLQQGGKDDLAVAADGSFTFATKVATLAPFAVTVAVSPSAPAQTCTVAGGTGTVMQGNVVSVAVNCTTDKFAVGGTVSGLSGAGLVLTSGGVDVPVAANGDWAFPDPLASGTAYAVTVKTQPAGQSCDVASGAGTVGGTPVSTIAVTCTATSFAVGGTVSGLTGTVVLAQSGGDDLTVSQNGAFEFDTVLAEGSPYAVTVKTQPADQFCSVKTTTASGTMGTAPVTSVDVACTSFANASFENGFAGWTLASTTASPDYGALTVLASGTALATYDTVHDDVNDHDVELYYMPNGYSLNALSPASGSKLAFACTANGPSEFRATRVLDLSANVTTMSFEVQYVSQTSFVTGTHYVSVELHDVATDDLLATLYLAGDGAPQTAAPAVTTVDVSAYAGTSVRLKLTSRGWYAPLYTGFDNFRLD